MTALWNALRSEVMGTVDDFRERGVVETFRNAALDMRDLARDAVTKVSEQVPLATFLGETTGVVKSDVVPSHGDRMQLELPTGELLPCEVLDVDAISQPPRLRVMVEGETEPRVVALRPASRQPERAAAAVHGDVAAAPAAAASSSAAPAAADDVSPAEAAEADARASAARGSTTAAAVAAAGSRGFTAASQLGSQVFDGFKTAWNDTVHEFEEKGFVGAVKDGTLDAVDLLGDAAWTIKDGAMHLAAPLIDLGDDDNEEEEGVVRAAAGTAAAAAAPAASGAAAYDSFLMGEASASGSGSTSGSGFGSARIGGGGGGGDGAGLGLGTLTEEASLAPKDKKSQEEEEEIS